MMSFRDIEISTFYASRRAKLLRRFDKIARRAGTFLTVRYGKEFTDIVTAETRAAFHRIIPDIPYIGGRKNQFSPVMVINGWIISFYRVMKKHGKSAEETVSICCQVADDFMGSIPRAMVWVLRRLAFGKVVLQRMKKQARQSQNRRYPDDFVYAVIEGDGSDFEWALAFSECAVNKFYEAQGVEALKPYCNFFDVIYSRYLQMGVDASTTIGIGCKTCRLAYKKDRETIIPEQLKSVILC